MKFIFLISYLLRCVDFTAVLANDALESYYKSMIVLDVYHEKFTSHLRDEYLQLSLGPRAEDYSTTLLLFEEKEENVPDLVMRKEDIRWNHLYLSATPFQPLTLTQNFANGFAWFSAFREMLNFRVGALLYKKGNRHDLSKRCSTMAAYFTMFQSILLQDRLYEFGNIIDDYNREKTSSLMPTYFKPAKDSKSGKDALATAKNMELLSKVTEVLTEVMEYRTVRRQFPVTPSDPWVFPSNEERAKTSESAVDVIKEELARDFYLREDPETGEGAAGLVEKLQGLKMEETQFEISRGDDIEGRQRPTAESTERLELPEQASSSAAPEETVAREREPSEEEKERLWREYSANLKHIEEKYTNNLEEDEDVFYYKCVWKELLAIYGDAYEQVTEFFHFAISGSSYKSMVEPRTESFEDYIPNMDESVAVWEKVEELLVVAKEDYEPQKSPADKALESRPITILQKIEKIRLAYRSKDAVVDESRLHTKWTLEYVNSKSESADLKVV